MTPLQAAFPALHFPFAQDEAIGSSRPCSSDGRFIPKLLALDCLAQVLLFFSFFNLLLSAEDDAKRLFAADAL